MLFSATRLCVPTPSNCISHSMRWSRKGGSMDTLRTESLSWAITHLLRFGDTDVLPIPFEFRAIRAYQSEVVAQLSSINLDAHRTRAYVRVLTPKYPTGFRIISQLDPIDTLILTAIAYEASGPVEAFRASPELKIACSHRLAPQANPIDKTLPSFLSFRKRASNSWQREGAVLGIGEFVAARKAGSFVTMAR